MLVATWNVNSIRARHERVLSWLNKVEPDVIVLQETKCVDDALRAEEFVEIGYEVAHFGVNHWNGVTILSRVGLDDVRSGFSGVNRPPFDEARLISAVCGGIRVWSIYAPNGRALDDPHYLYKLVWLERLRAEIDPSEPNVVAGDFNVAPADIDIYNPARWKNRTHASAEERAAISSIMDRGLRDIIREHHPEPGVYTWYSYRPNQFEKNQGLRIDLALCTDDVADRVESVTIDLVERAEEKPSDHTPVILDIDWPA